MKTLQMLEQLLIETTAASAAEDASQLTWRLTR